MIEKLSGTQIDGFYSRLRVGNDEECWIWNGQRNEIGHGVINYMVEGKHVKFQAARIAYFIANDGFDESKRLDKRCFNKACCNPKHMVIGGNKIIDLNETQRTCIKCGIIKPINKFHLKLPSSVCTNCRNKPALAKSSRMRKTGESRGRNILGATRAVDKKMGRENDLTIEFIEIKIAEGCFYCGEVRRDRMSLDRIDNQLGHLQSNVNACCMLCNFTRRDIPYEVWIILAPKMREIREFGLWENYELPHRRKKKIQQVIKVY